ncbi:MAG: Na/Pi cotransporter family protein [Bacteroidota bacterium]|jgi:phosphate:Na+ symporter
MDSINIWQLFAGLSLFLYGMFHLEDALRQLEGRSFKLFLKKHTKNKLSAIINGTLVTGILQSSSIVNLMVLSFVGAGMLSMRNALGVVLGANIGGTVNSWLVALLGFKVDLGNATFPIIAIAGLAMVIFKERKNYYQVSRFLFGFGLLFMGLDYMKQSMDAAIHNFNFAPYLNYPRVIFLLIGLLITSVIQTSAATVVIVLSALNASIIPLETAVSVILGAELGTTVKVAIGAIGGIAAKKRVALGNIMFNLASTLIGFLFLDFIIHIISEIFGITDSLFILVAFQSFINIIGALLFYFFLNRLGDFLEKSFEDKSQRATMYLSGYLNDAPEAALDLFEKEVDLFIQRVIYFSDKIFNPHIVSGEGTFNEHKSTILFKEESNLHEMYNFLKQAEGEMLIFYNQLLQSNISTENLNRLNVLINVVRSALYASKSLKDVIHDVNEFSNSSNEIKFNSFKEFQIEMNRFNQALKDITDKSDKTKIFSDLKLLMKMVNKEYKKEILDIYDIVSKRQLSELNISTLFNLNREVYDASKLMILAVKDFLLDESQAALFDGQTEFSESSNNIQNNTD